MPTLERVGIKCTQGTCQEALPYSICVLFPHYSITKQSENSNGDINVQQRQNMKTFLWNKACSELVSSINW